MWQSGRGEAYETAIAQLRDEGRIYECFCTRAEIRAASSAPHGPLPEGAYPGTCLRLTDGERRRKRAGGRPPALRLRADAERIAFEDRLMGRIESEGARMGGLVEDLLTLARLDQRRPLTIAPVDLAELAGDAVHDARAVQPDRPIALHLDESLTDVPVVLGDEARLRQVVGNLMTNALTHTPEDGEVVVRVAEREEGVEFSVTDSGPGIPDEHRESVFEKYGQLGARREGTTANKGLGLTFCRMAVEAHGGTIWVDDADGGGAAFRVILPAATEPDRTDTERRLAAVRF